jgi:hypothetical protein
VWISGFISQRAVATFTYGEIAQHYWGNRPKSERHLYKRYGGTMADLQEAFEEALREERLKAFHIAYKAGFRAAEFRDNEHQAMKDKVQPATDAEITRSGEKALRSDAA